MAQPSARQTGEDQPISPTIGGLCLASRQLTGSAVAGKSPPHDAMIRGPRMLDQPIDCVVDSAEEARPLHASAQTA